MRARDALVHSGHVQPAVHGVARRPRPAGAPVRVAGVAGAGRRDGRRHRRHRQPVGAARHPARRRRPVRPRGAVDARGHGATAAALRARPHVTRGVAVGDAAPLAAAVAGAVAGAVTVRSRGEHSRQEHRCAISVAHRMICVQRRSAVLIAFKYKIVTISHTFYHLCMHI